MLQKIDNFISDLKKLKSNNAFNPWSDQCIPSDATNAAETRCNNLQQVLEAAVDKKVRSLWVARDLSYLGGRRTGLAMTDEQRLQNCEKMFNVQLEKATTNSVEKEIVAGQVWPMLNRIGQPVFLWNVFPLHPYKKPDQPLTNRCHTAAERKQGKPFLKRLISLLEPEKIVAIGNEAHAALQEYSSKYETHKARHPSRGGASDFRKDIKQAYGL